MLPRTIPALRALASATRINTSHVRCMGAVMKPEHELVREMKNSYNDLPVPQGSWQEYHDKRNSKWNMQLGASLAFFVVTMGVMWKTGNWYLHEFKDYKKHTVNPGLKVVAEEADE